MDIAGYATLTRQSGLMREMQAVANNIANLATDGYRKEGVIFSEYVHRMGNDTPSVSMAAARVRMTSHLQGALEQTGGSHDLAIEGEGYFLIETAEGEGLTRAGAFRSNEVGEIVTPDGNRLLDEAGQPVVIPPDTAAFAVARDGTVSADGNPVTRIGLFRPANPQDAERRDGVVLALNAPAEPVVEGGFILQGHVEGSNVAPVAEVARMIEVQRAYELGQSFMEREDERVRNVLKTLGR